MLLMCDFETSTEAVSAEETWVWAVCSTDINKALWDTPTDDLEYVYHSSFESWFKWLLQLESSKVFFHNLKFDGSFITDYLVRNGYVYIGRKETPRPNTFTCLISDNNWFSVKIHGDYERKKNGEPRLIRGKPVVKEYTIQDSSKKIPVSVKEAAKAYGLDVLKGELDYDLYRPVGHTLTDDERLYISHDVGIIAKVLRLFIVDQNMDKLTISSDAMANYKKQLGDFDKTLKEQKLFLSLFPQISDSEDDFVRKQYKGGWTYVNPLRKEIDITERELIGGLSEHHKNHLRELGFNDTQINKAVIEVFDVNQLYPSRMYYELLPVGKGVYYEGEFDGDEEYFLYVQRIKARYKLKEGKFPMIQKSCGRFTGLSVYSEESDGEEELTLTCVDLELFFDCYDVTYIEYIDGYKYRGCEGLFQSYIDHWMEVKKTAKGAKRQIAKLMLNSLYGKFGTNKTAQLKYPVYDSGKDVIVYKSFNDEKKAVYIPMATFITSYARAITVRAANACGDNFLYADTDSIHILIDRDLPEIDVDPVELGCWKLEGLASRGRYIRAKSYIEDMVEPDGSSKLEVKCCGLSDKAKEQVTWENFHTGLTIQNVNLKAKKIKGGTILKQTDFNIRKPTKPKSTEVDPTEANPAQS